MSVRDTDTWLEWDVRTSLNALRLTDEDAGAAKLALQLARTIDAIYMGENTSGATLTGMAAMATILLRTLESLGATPAARAAVKPKTGGENATAAVSRLDQLRTSRAARRPAGA